jgi:AAA domain-containing protein
MKNVPDLNNTKITFKDIQEDAMRHLHKLCNPNVLDACDVYRITRHTKIDKPVPVITINNEIISTEGNLTTISGASKSGKSAFTSILLAGAISTDGVIDGLEYVNVQPNTNKKAVIHIDTEQAKHKHQNNLLSVLSRANMDDCDYLLSYNIRELEIAQYTEVTNNICAGALATFKGIHLIVIDGIADFISDVNDAEQSTAIVKYFEELAIKYHTPIIVIVHTNPGSDKERGHLGSQCQRKCESLLIIKTEGNISFIEPKLLRMAGKANIPNIQFMYDKDRGYHIGCGVRSVNANDKILQRINKLSELCSHVLGGQKSLRYQKVIEEIMIHTGKSMNAVKSLFKELKAHKMIVKGEDGYWRVDNN